MTSENEKQLVMPPSSIWNQIAKISITEDKPIMLDYWLDSLEKKVLIGVKENKEKLLVKENANRYTWEGRLTNFCPLKQIDKKILDKKLSMTYADFKKIQLKTLVITK